MRRTSLRALGHSTALLPAGAFLAACFGSSTNPFPVIDAGFAFDAGQTLMFDGSLGDAISAEGGGEAGDAADASDAQGVFSTATVDFGLVSCGSAPAVPTRTYSFQNTAPAAITYSAAVSAGSLFSVQGAASGTLQEGQTGSITVSAGTVPASSTAGTPLTGTLTLTTNIPGATTVVVPLQVTPQGGSLTTSPAVVGFGQVELAVEAPALPVTVTNVGNAPVGVTLGAPSDAEFAVTYAGAPAAATLAPGATLAGAQIEFTPTSAGQKTATVALVTTGVLCASPASAISLSGEGTSEPVTVAPSPLDFGTVSCGSTGTARKVTIINGYAFAVTYTATLAAGTASPYTLDLPTGSVASKGMATLTVTPKAIPLPGSVAANAYGDSLTIATNAPSATPAVVPLTESASGAVLTLTAAKTSEGNVAANSSATLPFTVTNTGNVLASLSLSVTGAGFSGAFTTAATAAAGGGTASGNATFSPPSSSTGVAAGSVSVTGSGVVCVPAKPLAISAQPEVPVATFSATTVDFSTTCGGGASGVINVPIANGGNTPLVLSDVTTSSGRVSVVSAPAMIAAGTSGAIVLQANAVAAQGSTAAGTYGDTLSFITNELGAPVHIVDLSVAVHGANLAFTGVTGGDLLTFTPAGPCDDSGPLPFISYGVTNTGDMAATVMGPTDFEGSDGFTEADGTALFTGALGNGTDDLLQGTFAVEPVSIGPGVTVTDSIREYDRYYPTNGVDNPCSGTDSFTYAVAGGPICVTLPALLYNFNFTPAPGQAECECPPPPPPG
jgi:hypothetical protein